jgi:uncharacterized protein
MLKTSEYNFLWPLEDSESAVIYNSFTGAAMEINNKFLDLLSDKREINMELLNQEQENVVNELEKNGFLIEDYINEKKILKYRNMKDKFNKEKLTLTILPTFQCNLRCFYCFQDRGKTEYMSQQVQEGIIQFVKKSIKGVKELRVIWFGGEPLMAWDIICSMSKELIKIAEENECQYTASMVSNGYLLNDNKVSRFIELGIHSVQITLDGPPVLHSLRKGMLGNPETNFNVILEHIRALLKAEVDVKIRINIDKSNMSSVEELLDLLSRSHIEGATLYPAMIEPYTSICSNIESSCLQRDEFAELEIWYYKKLIEKGLMNDFVATLPTLKGNFCIIDQINSFSIDPGGYVYKCWNTIGDKEKRIMDVMGRKQEDMEKKKWNMLLIEGMTSDPFEKKSCLECKLLPVCMGSCPYQSRGIYDEEPDCLTVKDNIKDLIINHITNVKISKLFQ